MKYYNSKTISSSSSHSLPFENWLSQWRELPMKQCFKTSYSWNSVYFHFQKWYKNDSWQKLWQMLLVKFKSVLDLSTIQLDSTHTPIKRGVEAVEYQGRKKCKTSNMLILVDNNGIPIASSEPITRNHNDLFNIVVDFKYMISPLRNFDIVLMVYS
jgi:hypothetical protein